MLNAVTLSASLAPEGYGRKAPRGRKRAIQNRGREQPLRRCDHCMWYRTGDRFPVWNAWTG